MSRVHRGEVRPEREKRDGEGVERGGQGGEGRSKNRGERERGEKCTSILLPLFSTPRIL